MTSPDLPVLDASQTQARLPMAELCRQIEVAAAEMAAGRIQSPARQVLALPAGGNMLSMPASASDIAIHKLVNVCPGNAARQLATIHGVVSVYDAITGVPRLLLDGPTVTARRTAAVSLLAVRTLQQAPPRHVALIGTGTQARAHAQALAELYPGLRLDVHGRTRERAIACCHQLAHLPLVLAPGSGAIAGGADVVILLTTSRTPLYDESARRDRLLIGTGAFRPDMAELGPCSIASSQVFCDDVAGARHEAGDLIQAGVDWSRVHSLAEALAGRIDMKKPRLFKSVGSAAWDLAAARCALATT
ncbi:bifunctional Delta(1)-pyrroline-2-carboxylate/Delta(1)-piperideine-2-carboxylate reductase [Craterilacuibacter sinensis]|uniref:Delta(1)-pyrroline-2-carboxylate reductase family protein n=1 Tax=Craterilacuibacter sinensis TaxID=2686017 RepID=A0A845BQ05_9NEIS|nr:bifunctional Delta(1)-pyrroline-2-carboxylate/Delta(1)-piperideine-2-carboxylate reductase [Craterilacuibacter sinensis]MXR37480.1 delta(1)-pyrroline-2-carboxylate reductase family protein [Craterilacuibacter sinensis]